MTQTTNGVVAATKRCDNTSVGILIHDDQGRLLVFNRATLPWGAAPPAGHIDDHGSPEQAATAEVSEEVGLTVDSLELIARRWRDNRCRRADGPQGVGHEWFIYRAEVHGELAPSPRETRNARWLTAGELQVLSLRTALYAYGDITEAEWQHEPGIEPVWVLFLSMAGLITAHREDLAAIEDTAAGQVRA
ncbi:NUDIX hydrolase [Nonomuraea sp. NPDC026600]|uniref:NUDIX hydrolase n=1 Tax=Nonomuraea sp. NPDC026600 TaxID=3155363 RepID=UPI0033E1BFBB